MRFFCLTSVAAVLLAGCGGSDDSGERGKPVPGRQVEGHKTPPVAALLLEKPESEHLPNLLKITDDVYTGGEPHDDDAFAELAMLGVKTVISVDGAIPDVEAARRHGLRYVHIPIGYDGITEEEGKAFAALAREAQRPLYIHCHHGNHRGPAGAAVTCIAAGLTDGKHARAILEAAGTSPDYAGLWRDVENYTPPDQDADLPELVETARLESLTAAMAGIDRAFDNLKLARNSGWKPPSDHPDLEPVVEAVVVREGFHEAARNLDSSRTQEFRDLLGRAEDQARDLEDALRRPAENNVEAAFTTLQETCKSCHKRWRN